MAIEITPNDSLLDKAGIPRHLAWGYLGILIFMMGDGVEQGWLSPYLLERGMSIQQSAFLFTMYGVTIAISSWFSGVLAEGFGPKKTDRFLSLLDAPFFFPSARADTPADT